MTSETLTEAKKCWDCGQSPCICGDIFPFARTYTPDGKIYDHNGGLLEDLSIDYPERYPDRSRSVQEIAAAYDGLALGTAEAVLPALPAPLDVDTDFGNRHFSPVTLDNPRAQADGEYVFSDEHDEYLQHFTCAACGQYKPFNIRTSDADGGLYFCSMTCRRAHDALARAEQLSRDYVARGLCGGCGSRLYTAKEKEMQNCRVCQIAESSYDENGRYITVALPHWQRSDSSIDLEVYRGDDLETAIRVADNALAADSALQGVFVMDSMASEPDTLYSYCRVPCQTCGRILGEDIGPNCTRCNDIDAARFRLESALAHAENILGLKDTAAIVENTLNVEVEKCCPGCDNALSRCYCCPDCTADNGGKKTVCTITPGRPYGDFRDSSGNLIAVGSEALSSDPIS
jgi:hypothetical protein